MKRKPLPARRQLAQGAEQRGQVRLASELPPSRER